MGIGIFETKWTFAGSWATQIFLSATSYIRLIPMHHGFMVDPVTKTVVLLICISAVLVCANIWAQITQNVGSSNSQSSRLPTQSFGSTYCQFV
jgi:phosphate starvation-inducible membrane PsiE